MPGHGAFAFPFDPDQSPSETPALWDPACTAAIVIIDPGRDFPALDTIAGLQSRLQGDDGCHLVLRARGRTVRLWLRAGPAALATTGFHLPHDPLFEGRLHATRHVRLWLDGAARATGPMPGDLSPFQAARLDVLLALLDAQAFGASLRQLAQLAYPALPALSASQWKASSERRGTHRLLGQALQMRDGGYRRLLREG